MFLIKGRESAQELLYINVIMIISVLCFPAESQTAVEEWELTRCVEDVYKVRTRHLTMSLFNGTFCVITINPVCSASVRSGWLETVHQLLYSKL